MPLIDALASWPILVSTRFMVAVIKCSLLGAISYNVLSETFNFAAISAIVKPEIPISRSFSNSSITCMCLDVSSFKDLSFLVDTIAIIIPLVQLSLKQLRSLTGHFLGQKAQQLPHLHWLSQCGSFSSPRS